MSTKMQYRHFASVESILGSGIKLVPESQYRMPRLHLSPCFALRCWKLLKWDLSFWYFWYFWVVDIVLATSNQLPAQQAPRRMALGCQLACSKELKSVPEAGTLEKKKLDRPCVATRIQRLRYAWRLHSKFQLGQQRFQQEGLGTGPVPREPCLSPKIGGPQSVFFRGETNGFVGASSIQISATFLPFFFAPCGSCHGAILHPRMIHLQKHHWNKWIWVQLRSPIDYSTLRWQIFKNRIQEPDMSMTANCHQTLSLSTPDHRISSAHTGEHGEHGELSQRTEILRSVRTPSNAAGTNDFLPNSSSASGRPGGESVPEFAKFHGKNWWFKYRSFGFYYKNKRKVMV